MWTTLYLAVLLALSVLTILNRARSVVNEARSHAMTDDPRASRRNVVYATAGVYALLIVASRLCGCVSAATRRANTASCTTACGPGGG